MMFTVHEFRLHPVRVTLKTSSLKCVSGYTPPRVVARYRLAPCCASTCGPYTSTVEPPATSIPNRIDSAAAAGVAAHTTRLHPSVATRSNACPPIDTFTVVGVADRRYTLKQYGYPPGASMVCASTCPAAPELLTAHARVPPAGSATPSDKCSRGSFCQTS